jgi:hypothetical protein
MSSRDVWRIAEIHFHHSGTFLIDNLIAVCAIWHDG